VSASDFAPYSKVLKCGCILHAEFPLHVDGNVSIDWCKLHSSAGALRNVVRWLHRVEDFWPISAECDERIRYALEQVGDS
jgi:hypothetical protein